MVEQHILSTLHVLTLVYPEQAHYFYQHYVEGCDIQDIAHSCKKTTKTVQRGLHGWAHNKGEELGAEDWFIILLQLFFEAEYLVDAADALTSCFSNAVSGLTNPIRSPFHRSFFALLVNALDPRDPAQSLPWTRAAANDQPNGHTLRHIMWPAFYPPLEHDKLPGLLAVIRDATSSEERSWLCIIAVLLAEYADVWGKTLDLLNPPLKKCLPRLPGHMRKKVTASAQKLLDSLTDPFQKNAVLAILVNGPCDWEQLVTPQMAALDRSHRIITCAKQALVILEKSKQP